MELYSKTVSREDAKDFFQTIANHIRAFGMLCESSHPHYRTLEKALYAVDKMEAFLDDDFETLWRMEQHETFTERARAQRLENQLAVTEHELNQHLESQLDAKEPTATKKAPAHTPSIGLLKKSYNTTQTSDTELPPLIKPDGSFIDVTLTPPFRSATHVNGVDDDMYADMPPLIAPESEIWSRAVRVESGAPRAQD